jgi:maltose-binding protein MalE
MHINNQTKNSVVIGFNSPGKNTDSIIPPGGQVFKNKLYLTQRGDTQMISKGVWRLTVYTGTAHNQGTGKIGDFNITFECANTGDTPSICNQTWEKSRVTPNGSHNYTTVNVHVTDDYTVIVNIKNPPVYNPAQIEH